jgi:hypothetical protein
VLRIDHFGKHSDEAGLQAETSRIAVHERTATPPEERKLMQ